MKMQFIQLLTISIIELINMLPSHSTINLCYWWQNTNDYSEENTYKFLLSRAEFYNLIKN